MDIDKIPIEDLLQDRTASLKDIKVCAEALLLGVKTYSGGLCMYRLEKNLQIVKTIDKELENRSQEETIQ